MTRSFDRAKIKEELQAFMEAEAISNARKNILPFVTYTMPEYRVNWHHRIICEYLDRLVRGEIRRLMIFSPPRSGKSELVSRRLPAYALGVDPDEQVIACSYADALAARMNRDVQRIIDLPLYAEVFPGTKLFGQNIRTVSQNTWLRNSDFFEVVDHRGSYRSAGVGGGITGMGATLGVIDDPIKNHQDASSKTIRDSQWEWATTTFMTRLSSDARVLLTLTRWHEDDLASRFIKAAQSGEFGGEPWTVISFPALREEGIPTHPADPRNIGEPLWPSEYPIEFLNEQRVNLGSYLFGAICQQSPKPAGGNIIHRDWLVKRWQSIPEGSQWIQSWDLSFDKTDTSSFVVGQVWAALGARRFLVHQLRRRMEFTESIAAMREVTALFPQANTILVEKKANGAALISSLKGEISGIIPVEPSGSKEARLRAVAPQFEAGNIELPERSVWLGDYIEELVGFPNAPNDDQADTTSQALLRLSQRTTLLVVPQSVLRVSPVAV